MNKRAIQKALATLTPREREVLHWVCECKTDAEIGRILGISVHTVSKHLQRVFSKLGVENRIGAARLVSFGVSHTDSRGANQDRGRLKPSTRQRNGQRTK